MKAVRERDYLFDNYKVLLMFLVVTGHFIGPSADDNALLAAIKWIIVSFHMPAFIFISGYFSKRDLPLKSLIQKLAIPYLIYELMYYFLYTYVTHQPTELALLKPKFSLWYLMALFFWRIITPYVKKIPFHLPLSVIAGLLIGCSGMDNNFLSIPRILVFYPFFLMGIHFRPEMLNKLRSRTGKLLSAAALALTGLFLLIGPFTEKYSMKIFYGRYSYTELNQGMLEGILCRMVCYLTAFLITFALLALMSNRQNRFSYLGTRTMPVYLFHGLLYSYLKAEFTFLHTIDTLTESIALLVFCALLTWVLAAKPLNTFTTAAGRIRLPKAAHPVYSYIRRWYL